ncbi:PorT family protein [Mucilaginibacter sp. X4EP1]|uniref:PorT family protein n=1 Tax=Mucilaginibacter sp. X4EP1 TaxID=2723092 RepID=UPI0021673F98|nr:PorT family protein [Mucilaginibacter sp. X4EP1]MCS3816408.1 hypothetical protein [Mucilaginibacter sp. X4EP1]
MKSSFKYLTLWQKKRSELLVNDDPQTGWMEMQSLLDEHLPVSGEKTSRFKKIKILPSLFIAFSAAAMVYTSAHIILNKVRHTHGHYTTLNKQHFAVHPMAGNLTGDSLLSTNQPLNGTDSTTSANGSAKKITIGSVPGNTIRGTIASGITPNAPSVSSQNKNQPVITTRGSNRSGLATPSGDKTIVSLKKSPLASLANNNPANSKKKNAAISANNGTTPDKKPNAGLLGGSKINNAKVSPSLHNNVLASTSKRSSHFSAGSNYHLQNTSNGSQKNEFHNRGNHNRNQKETLINNDGQAVDDVNGSDDLTATPPQQNLLSHNNVNTIIILQHKPGKQQGLTSSNTNNKVKKGKISKNSGPFNIDWGILSGVNTSGSFTSSKQNSNFYGSLPVDAYFGLFASYNLNDKWAIGLQTQFYSPQTIITNYTHANNSKVDSAQLLQITASRKVYTVNIPIHVIFKVSNYVNVIGGPVIGIPVKQTNAGSTLLPYNIRTDSTYYKSISTMLNQTQYQQKLNFGFNAGVDLHYKRWLFEADYLRSLSGYSVSSGLGTYKSNNGTFQFTIGFQISKPRQ